MKILYIVTAVTGGTQTVVENLVEYFKKEHNIYILQGYSDYYCEDLKFNTIINETIVRSEINLRDRYNSRKVKNYSDKNILSVLKRYLDWVNPDLVHIHSLDAIGVLILDILKEKHIPIIFTIHDFWLICPKYFFANNNMTVCEKEKSLDFSCCCINNAFMNKRILVLREAIKKANAITAPSEYVARIFERVFENEIIVQVIEHNLGIQEIDSLKIEKSHSNIIRFGYLGGLNPFKGLGVLLKALWRTNGRLAIVIGGIATIENPFVRKYSFVKKLYYLINRAFSNRYFITKMINILRIAIIKIFKRNIKIKIFPKIKKEEMSSFYRNVDILIVPSIVKETYSMIVRESFAYKTPVIVSKCGGPEFIVRDKINGLTFEVNDPSSLNNAIEQLANNEDQIKNMEKNILNINLKNEAFQNLRMFENLYNIVKS